MIAPDLGSIDFCRLQGMLGAAGTHLARQDARLPQPPLANTAHQFQATGRQPQPLVERSQLGFNLVRG